MKLFIAEPHGFCAGVERSLGMLDAAIKHYGTPLFVNHEIVHNAILVQYYEKRGVVFTDDLSMVPPGAIMLLSAHGAEKDFVKQAQKKEIRLIDTTCPLVTKIHMEAKHFTSKGYEIIYIGKKNHQEALGVKNVAPEHIHIITNEADIKSLNISPTKPLALLNQTTLSIDDTKYLREIVQKKYPQIELPMVDDICYATTNRQQAVKRILPYIDVLIVIGSQNSSNSQKLKLLGETFGIPSILVDTREQIPNNFFLGVEKVGLSSGASAPESLLQEVIDSLVQQGGIIQHNIKGVEEKMFFPFSLKEIEYDTYV